MSSRSSSGSVSARNSRERSLSIASSLEDDDIVKPKRRTSNQNETSKDQKATEVHENDTNVGAGGWGDDAEDAEYPITKQSAETLESSIKKSRRSSSIASIAGMKSRSDSLVNPDTLEISKNLTDIKQLETELTKQVSETLESSGNKSRSSSIVITTRSDSIVSAGNKSRSDSIVNLDVLDKVKGTVESKQLETEPIKPTSDTKEGSGKKSRPNSIKNKSRSGSLINSDNLDNSKTNIETKQLETESEQPKNKSRSSSIISFGKLSKRGSTVTQEQVEASKQQDIQDSILAIPPGTLNIPDTTPEKMSQPSENSMTRSEKSVSRNNSKKNEKLKSNNNSSALNYSNFDLSARDIERAKFAFSIYDFDGSGRVDGFYIGDILRALNLNPTNAVIQSLGGTARKREKKITVGEFLPIYAECRKNKKAGSFEDFMEVLKTYDRMEDGNLYLVELEHILLHLGERMEKSEIDAVFVDCLPEEDDDGQIVYENFLRKLCEGLM